MRYSKPCQISTNLHNYLMTVRQLKRNCGACRPDAAVDLLCIRLSHGAADIAKHKSGSADSVTGIIARAESGGEGWGGNSRSTIRPSLSASIALTSTNNGRRCMFLGLSLK